MKKVININFQGQVIAIEETAYEILKQYIGSLKSYFSREDGGDEIVNDIECRIAELFGNRLKHGINCITDEDVEAVIDSIGMPQDFDSDYEETENVTGQDFRSNQSREESIGTSAKEPENNTTERHSLYRNSGDRIIGGVCSGLANYLATDPVWIRLLFVLFFGLLFWVYIVLWIVLKPKVLESSVTKRLYRNPNDRFIGGVCGGMAAYFRIDSWIPRLIFLMPLMLNMMGMISIFPLNRIFDNIGFNWNINSGMIIVYVVFWMIIPEAKTVKQKLEMMGEEDYIRSIREKVNDNVTSSKNRTSNDANLHTEDELRGKKKIEQMSQPDIKGTSSKFMDEMPPDPSVSGHREDVSTQSQRSGCLNVFVILLKIILFSFVGLFLLVLIAVFFGLLLTGTQLSPLKSLFIDTGYETSLLYTSLGLLFLVPVIAIITWVVRRSMKMKSRPVIGIIASIFWVVGLVLSGILGSRVAAKFSVESSNERTVSIAPISSSKMYVEMLPYAEDYAEFKSGYGPGADIDKLPYMNINEDSLLFNDINLQIGKSSDSLFRVRVMSATHGKDLRSAKDNLEQFAYEIVQKDSLLLLPEFFSVPIAQGFRNQSITVEILVPGGRTVEMSEALRDYKDRRPPSVVRKRIRNYTRNANYMPVDVAEEVKAYTTLTSDSI